MSYRARRHLIRRSCTSRVFRGKPRGAVTSPAEFHIPSFRGTPTRAVPLSVNVEHARGRCDCTPSQIHHFVRKLGLSDCAGQASFPDKTRKKKSPPMAAAEILTRRASVRSLAPTLLARIFDSGGCKFVNRALRHRRSRLELGCRHDSDFGAAPRREQSVVLQPRFRRAYASSVGYSAGSEVRCWIPSAPSPKTAEQFRAV